MNLLQGSGELSEDETATESGDERIRSLTGGDKNAFSTPVLCCAAIKRFLSQIYIQIDSRTKTPLAAEGYSAFVSPKLFFGWVAPG